MFLHRLVRDRPPAVVRSLFVGGYALLCSLTVLLPTKFITDAVIQFLPGPNVSLVFVVPTPILGAIVWYAVVERRGSDGYAAGAVAGALTAVANVLVWVVVFSIVWSPQLVVAGGILVAALLAVAVPAGAVAALPLTFLRRRRGAHT